MASSTLSNILASKIDLISNGALKKPGMRKALTL
jgi:hypothetical protein